MTDIGMGDLLASQMLKLEQWPKDKIPPGAISRIEDIEGRRTRTRLYAGEPILENKLLGKGASQQGATALIPKGYRVVPVKVDLVSGGSSLILPGDRVDVMVHLVRDPSRDIPETVTRTILQDIKVFAVNDVLDLEKEKDGGKSIVAKTISLLVTPEQAAKVMLASQMGIVNLVMRSPEDDQPSANVQATPNELFGTATKSNREKEELQALPDPKPVEKAPRRPSPRATRGPCGFSSRARWTRCRSRRGDEDRLGVAVRAMEGNHDDQYFRRRAAGERGNEGRGAAGGPRASPPPAATQERFNAEAQGRLRGRCKELVGDFPVRPNGRRNPHVTRLITPGSRMTLFRAAGLGLDCKEYKDVYAISVAALGAVGGPGVAVVGRSCPATVCSAGNAQQPSAPPVLLEKPSIVYKVQSPSERLEMTVHTSRILTMDQKIPQAQVNNPDILELTPLSPNQIQIAAKAAGVTQVNLWDENKKLYTIDVIVFGDVRELTMVLRSAFPNAALKVVPVANAVMISGFVDQPEHIDRIVRIAEEYYPKVINNMTVGGVQQVLLHVKVMEVSRTKLRQLGFDWAKITGGNMVTSSPSGLIAQPSSPALPAGVPNTNMLPPLSTVTSNPISFDLCLQRDERHQRVFRRARRPAAGRPDEDHVRADAGDHQRAGRLVQLRRRDPRARAAKPGHDLHLLEEVRHADRLRADRAGQRENPPGSPAPHQRTRSTQSLQHQRHSGPGHQGPRGRHGVEMQAGQTLAIAGLVQTVIEAENNGTALDQRTALSRGGVPQRERDQERGRVADPGHAGIGRSHGRLRSAAVRAGHADHQPQRLGTVHEGAPGSAQLLSAAAAPAMASARRAAPIRTVRRRTG